MKHLCLVMQSYVETTDEENVIKSSNPIFVDDYETAIDWISEQNERFRDTKTFKFVYWIEFIEDFRKGAK